MVLGDLDLEIAAIKLTRLTSQPPADSYREIPLDCRMASGAAGHSDGLDTVKFVAQFPPLFPFEEFGQRHGFTNSKVHNGHPSTV